jgi:uroporphyrinogen-III synthase
LLTSARVIAEAGTCGVLITRPAGDAPATARRLADLGYTPVVAPVMQIIAPLARNLPHQVQALILTSGNAVAGLPPPTTWRRPDMPVLAVGDVTAAKARAHGFANVLSAGRDADALVELAASRLDPSRGALLLACGRNQGFVVGRALRARGFRVTRRSVYAAVPVRAFPAPAEEAIRNHMLDAAMFLSAETAAAFARLLPERLVCGLSRVRALAIGKAAADALKPLPWRAVQIAATPTLDGVLALL